MSTDRAPGWALAAAWVGYVAFLAFAFPLTPLAALAMIVPLLLTGWSVPRWNLAATVGLVHGGALAGVGWAIGAFDGWGPDALPLAMALVVLLSWALSLAGWTLRVVALLRHRTRDLEAARGEILANAETVDAIYSASAAALIGLSRDGTIVSWNPGAQTTFGHSPDHAVGAPIDILGAQGHRENCIGRIRYVVETGREMATFAGKLCHADGHIMDVEVRPRSIRMPDGQGVLLTIVDRTRETALSDEVARQAQKQERIINNLDEVLYSVAVPSMETLMLSRGVEQLTGQDTAAWNDFAAFLELAHPDDREEVMRRWEHARSGEKSVLRWRLRTSLGEHVWVEDRVVPARDEEGRVIRVDGTIRRIARELELERQAQRMMRWLDALEPMTGGGAWSLDLRTGQWQWSAGMRQILAMDEEPENGMDAWRARLYADSMRSFELLVEQPDQPVPLVLQTAGPAGTETYLLEPWVQRGADDEAIWLYGIVRPRGARLRDDVPEGTYPATLPDDAGPPTEASAEPAPTLTPARAAGLAIEVDHGAGSQAAVSAPTPWGRHVADLEVARLVRDAERRAIDAVLAAEQHAAEKAAERALEQARRIEQEAEQAIQAAQAAAMEQVQAARRAAVEEAQRAREARAAQEAAEREMGNAQAAAEHIKQDAVREAEVARAEALQQAEAARERAQAEAARAERAEAARQAAEAARQEALQEAAQAKRQAMEEAQRARKEALAQAETARRQAEEEAEKARKAGAALQAAEQARKQAVEAAQQAQAKALQEAGKTRTEAMRIAQEADERAKAEAAKAQQAEQARREAEQARQRAFEAAEQAKSQALRDADEARDAALKVAKEAQARAEQEAKKASDAHEALLAAQEAQEEAQRAARAAQQKEARAEEAGKKAIAQAQAAKDDALRRAEEAVAAARADALRAQEAEKARALAEEEMSQVLAQAEAVAEEARAEAERVKAAATKEADQARAAARAETAKAEEAQKALQAAQRDRDSAIHEAQRARDEAVAAAHAARDEALRRLDETRNAKVVQAEPARPEPVPDVAPQTAPARPASIWGSEPEAEAPEMDVVWDDEIGWVPRPRGGKDKAEQLKAKSWTSESERGKGSGPWALD